jgi:2-hydroxychromene-2-carboxylate isomerase
MIPTLTELAQKFGVNTTFVPVALAGVLTALVLLVPSIAQWFDDRKS